jgi:hypothetical protein
MATQQNRIDRGTNNGRSTVTTTTTTATEPQMADLLRQLGTDGAALVRSEMALAKLEMREMARQLAADSAKVVGAIALAMTGGIALTAAAVIGLGWLLGGRFGLSALILGVVMLAIGGMLAKSGIDGLKQPATPDETLSSLRETKDWAGDEVREFKEEIRS